MDDIKKQKAKNLKKAIDIADNVVDNFNKATQQLELKGLYERKDLLEKKIENTDLASATRANAILQLKTVNDSINLLEQEVSLLDEYDIDVDEEAARKFIEENNLLEDMSMINSNDALDELERTLGLGKKDD